MIKVGIIGSGKIVSWFLKDFKVLNNENVKVTGLYSRNEKTGNEYCEKWNIDNFYGTLEDFEKQDFDLIYIGTPEQVHVSLSKRMMEKGFSVYCEKPIAFTKEDVIDLYETAERNNVLFFDGIKTGFSPAYIEAKKWIQSGDIGNVILIHTTHTKVSTSLNKPDPDPDNKGFGFQFGGGVYSAFTALDIAGEIESFDHKSNPYPRNNNGISTSAILARHKNGTISTIIGSDYTTDNLTAVIQGEKGYIVLGGNLDKYNDSYKKDSCHMAHTATLHDLKNDVIKRFDDEFISEGEGLIFTMSHVFDLLIKGRKESDIMTKELSINIIDLLSKTNSIK